MSVGLQFKRRAVLSTKDWPRMPVPFEPIRTIATRASSAATGRKGQFDTAGMLGRGIGREDVDSPSALAGRAADIESQ